MLIVVAALLLPWIFGTALIAPCWTQGSAGRWPAMVGYGYFIGMAIALSLFWALQIGTGQWQVVPVLLLFAAVMLLAAVFRRQRLFPKESIGVLMGVALTPWRSSPLWARFLTLFALCLLVLWSVLVATEIRLRPVFPWDAWETWSYSAKAAYANPEALNEPWLRARFAQSMVPLLQVWQAVAAGQWHGVLVNVPWLLCSLALLIALYGQLRFAGSSFIGSFLIVVLVALTPLFTVNTALGGYPELWTCSTFALAVLAACLAVSKWCWRQAMLSAASAFMVVFTDRYAAGFPLLLLLAVVLALTPWRRSLSVLGAVLIVLVAWALTAGIRIDIPRLGILIINAGEFVLPKALSMQFILGEAPWSDAVRRLYLDATWGLLWVLTVVAAACSRPQWHDRGHRLLLLVVLPTFTVIMLMLLFSRLQLTVVDGTGINRWLFPLLPVVAFWTGLVFCRPRKLA